MTAHRFRVVGLCTLLFAVIILVLLLMNQRVHVAFSGTELGLVPETSALRVALRVVNKSPMDLEIVEILPTCKCTSLKENPTLISANSNSYLLFEFNLAGVDWKEGEALRPFETDVLFTLGAHGKTFKQVAQFTGAIRREFIVPEIGIPFRIGKGFDRSQFDVAELQVGTLSPHEHLDVSVNVNSNAHAFGHATVPFEVQHYSLTPHEHIVKVRSTTFLEPDSYRLDVKVATRLEPLESIVIPISINVESSYSVHPGTLVNSRRGEIFVVEISGLSTFHIDEVRPIGVSVDTSPLTNELSTSQMVEITLNEIAAGVILLWATDATSRRERLMIPVVESAFASE